MAGRRRYAAGFTLVELLAAVAVFAVFSVLAIGSLVGVAQGNARLEAAEDELRQLQYAMRRLTDDLYQLQPRPVRDLLGDSVAPALLAGARGEFPLELTRGGWSNTIGSPRGTDQRVAWFVDDRTLARLHWLVVDRTLNSQPVRVDVLEGVEQMTVRFMDASREWQTEWPPASLGPGANTLDASSARPLAVEIVLVVDGWGTLRRVVELSP